MVVVVDEREDGAMHVATLHGSADVEHVEGQRRPVGGQFSLHARPVAGVFRLAPVNGQPAPPVPADPSLRVLSGVLEGSNTNPMAAMVGMIENARRFEQQGPARTVALNWLIWMLFALGASPHRLARLYRHVR